MSEPVRLRHAQDTPGELVEALREARAQAPPPGSLDGILQGVRDGLGMPSPVPPDGGGAGGGPTPPAAPAAGGGGATGASAKALATGAIGAGATGAVIAALVLSQGASPPEPSSAPLVVSSVSADPISPKAPREPAIEPAPATSAPEADASQAPPSPRPRRAAGPALMEAPSETELLDAAQRALAAEPATALRHCAAHAAHHPAGALTQEREVMAIDALVRLGRHAEAEARAARFRAAYPSSGHLRRIDVLLGAREPDTASPSGATGP